MLLRRLLPGVYEGWIVVGASAAIVTMIGASFFYGFGTIFNPIVEEFGWSVAATSFAFSLRQETSGIAAPFVGLTIDRIGPTKVLFFGILTVAVGVVYMSFMQTIWQFYVGMMVIALGTSAAGGQVGLVAIATWFEARRARAMSLMTLGGGVGGLFVVFVAYLVEALGWRGALRALALIVLVFGSLAGVNVRSRPRRHHQPMDGIRRVDWGGELDDLPDWGVPIRRAVVSRAYLLLSVALIANGFATTALVVHQIPFLESVGVSKAAAGSTVAVFTLTSIVGRLGMGYLADKYHKPRMLAISMALVALGIPLMALVHELWQAVVVLLIIAPGFGGSIPVRPALLADHFGTLYFGTLNGVTSLTMTLGGFIGPLMVGYLVDRTGGYSLGWLICGAVAAVSPFAALAVSRGGTLSEQYRLAAAARPPGTDGP